MTESIRRCDFCGCEIDAVDWCDDCKKGSCTVHRRKRKRSDAKYCSPECRTEDIRQLRLLENKDSK